MKYLRGRLIIAKYITFNRGIRSSFETNRQQFYRFANLAINFIETSFAKMQLAFELFLQCVIPTKFAINKKYYIYLRYNNRT